jgi:hypothetical protein
MMLVQRLDPTRPAIGETRLNVSDDDDLRVLLQTLERKARDDLRRVLIRDQGPNLRAVREAADVRWASESDGLGTVVARTPCAEPAGDLFVRVPPVGRPSDPIAVVLSVRREMFPASPAAFGGVVRGPRPAVFRTRITEPFRWLAGGSHACGLPVLPGRETTTFDLR